MSEAPQSLDEESTVELAKERNREAADRTLLAWIRTSLALIAFGFGIDRIVEVVRSGTHQTSSGLTPFVGLSFMALGVYAVWSASIAYRRELRMLAEGRYRYDPRRSYTLHVAVVLAIVGAVGFIGILVQTLRH